MAIAKAMLERSSTTIGIVSNRLTHEVTIMAKDQNAVELSHKGGVVGGPARAAALSKVERKKIASKGGKAKKAKAQ